MEPRSESTTSMECSQSTIERRGSYYNTKYTQYQTLALTIHSTLVSYKDIIDAHYTKLVSDSQHRPMSYWVLAEDDTDPAQTPLLDADLASSVIKIKQRLSVQEHEITEREKRIREWHKLVSASFQSKHESDDDCSSNSSPPSYDIEAGLVKVHEYPESNSLNKRVEKKKALSPHKLGIALLIIILVIGIVLAAVTVVLIYFGDFNEANGAGNSTGHHIVTNESTHSSTTLTSIRALVTEATPKAPSYESTVESGTSEPVLTTTTVKPIMVTILSTIKPNVASIVLTTTTGRPTTTTTIDGSSIRKTNTVPNNENVSVEEITPETPLQTINITAPPVAMVEADRNQTTDSTTVTALPNEAANRSIIVANASNIASVKGSNITNDFNKSSTADNTTGTIQLTTTVGDINTENFTTEEVTPNEIANVENVIVINLLQSVNSTIPADVPIINSTIETETSTTVTTNSKSTNHDTDTSQSASTALPLAPLSQSNIQPELSLTQNQTISEYMAENSTRTDSAR